MTRALARVAARAAGSVRRPYVWMVDRWPGHNFEDDDDDLDESPEVASGAVEVDEPEADSPRARDGQSETDEDDPQEREPGVVAVVPAQDPGERRAQDAAEEPDPEEGAEPERVLEPVAAMGDADEGIAERRRRRLVPRRVPAFGLRQLAGIGRAVYSTLADPVIGADAETRARRAGRVRKAGMVAASGAMVGVLFYAIFPIRTFLDQWEAMRRAEERTDVFEREAQEAEEEIERLKDPEEVERIAREDYGLVEADEESVSLLPAPDGDEDSESGAAADGEG